LSFCVVLSTIIEGPVILRVKPLRTEVDQIDVGSDLEEKVIEISRNTVSAKSRAVYAGKKTAFLIWLDEHVQHLLSPFFSSKRSPKEMPIVL